MTSDPGEGILLSRAKGDGVVALGVCNRAHEDAGRTASRCRGEWRAFWTRAVPNRPSLARHARVCTSRRRMIVIATSRSHDLKPAAPSRRISGRPARVAPAITPAAEIQQRLEQVAGSLSADLRSFLVDRSRSKESWRVDHIGKSVHDDGPTARSSDLPLPYVGVTEICREQALNRRKENSSCEAIRSRAGIDTSSPSWGRTRSRSSCWSRTTERRQPDREPSVGRGDQADRIPQSMPPSPLDAVELR